MKQITIKFADFWPSFDPRDNVFVKALAAKYLVEVADGNSEEKPDILIYSVFGTDHYRYSDCVKVYYTGENDVPNFNECDYALSFHHIDFAGRHLRYPLYMMYEIDEALAPPAIADHEAVERGFCSLLMRNSADCDRHRLEIIDAVDAYRPLAYGGPFRNNVGGPVPLDQKIAFCRNYKFNLALENSPIEGYVTEKIIEPMAAPAVPIYWGAPDVALDFNPEAFVDVADYDSIGSFVTDLEAIDHDAGRYLAMLRAPRLRADRRIDFNERLSEFLCSIAARPVIKRARNARGRLLYHRASILNRLGHDDRIVNMLGRLMYR